MRDEMSNGLWDGVNQKGRDVSVRLSSFEDRVRVEMSEGAAQHRVQQADKARVWVEGV